MKLTKEEKLSLRKRTEKKIDEIESYLDKLNDFKPATFQEYEKDMEKRWACERACERIAEGVVDLAVFLIRIKEINYNDEDEKSFGVLFKNNIIDEKLCGRLRGLKGMRDHIAHRYGEVDDKIVFAAINDELERDVDVFLNIAKKITNEIQNGD